MSAITLCPRRSTAATVAWLRQADGNICATVGHSVWTLPDSPSSAEVLRELLEAAVAGRVSEIVRTWPASPNLFTQVRGRDGQEWIDEDSESATLGNPNSLGFVSGRAAQRLATGNHDYAPWSLE